jgi:hypothetical protein
MAFWELFGEPREPKWQRLTIGTMKFICVMQSKTQSPLLSLIYCMVEGVFMDFPVHGL